MSRSTSIGSALEPIVKDFAARLANLVEAHATAQARDAVLRALGAGAGASSQREGGAKNGTRGPASAKQVRARKLQGQYMGSLRTLSKPEQARVKALRAKEGVQAAIAAANKMKAAHRS